MGDRRSGCGRKRARTPLRRRRRRSGQRSRAAGSRGAGRRDPAGPPGLRPSGRLGGAGQGRAQGHAHAPRPALRLHGRAGVQGFPGRHGREIRRARHADLRAGRRAQDHRADRRHACRARQARTGRPHRADRPHQHPRRQPAEGGRPAARRSRHQCDDHHPARQAGSVRCHADPRDHQGRVGEGRAQARQHRLCPHHPVRRRYVGWIQERADRISSAMPMAA